MKVTKASWNQTGSYKEPEQITRVRNKLQKYVDSQEEIVLMTRTNRISNSASVIKLKKLYPRFALGYTEVVASKGSHMTKEKVPVTINYTSLIDSSYYIKKPDLS